MANNDWYDLHVARMPESQGPSAHCVCRLEIPRPVRGSWVKALKLRSTGYLIPGRTDLTDPSFAVTCVMVAVGDLSILYPESHDDRSNPGPSTCAGEWALPLQMPVGSQTVEFRDGDFDRRTGAILDAWLDDPNTTDDPLGRTRYGIGYRKRKLAVWINLGS